MLNLINLFTNHLKQENMTYLQHFKRSIKLSTKMAYGSICLFIHAFIPGFFVKSGSNTIKELYFIVNKKTG